MASRNVIIINKKKRKNSTKISCSNFSEKNYPSHFLGPSRSHGTGSYRHCCVGRHKIPFIRVDVSQVLDAAIDILMGNEGVEHVHVDERMVIYLVIEITGYAIIR